MLGCDGVHLPLDILLVEQGRREELGEAIQRLGKRRMGYLEKVIGVVVGRIGVAVSGVGRKVLLVLPGLGIFLGTQKQHVLQEMGHAGVFLRIFQGPGGYRHGRRRALRFRVGDQHHPQSVFQHQLTVGHLRSRLSQQLILRTLFELARFTSYCNHQKA